MNALHASSAACLIAIQAHAATYTFDHLAVGPANGQDAWVGTTNAVFVDACAPMIGVAFGSPAGGTPTGGAISRINNDDFRFPTAAGQLLVMGFEFRVDDANQLSSYFDFSLAEWDHGYTNEGKIGIQYFPTFDHLLIMRADGSAWAGGANNFGHVRGHCYRVEMRVDLAAYGGQGSASVFVKDLTAGTAFVPVGPLQNIGLLLLTQEVDPTQWDRMDVRASNAQVDNLVVIVPPNPCAGDSDHNRTVEFRDITSTLVWFGETVGPWSEGDADGSGAVNFADITAVLVNFGTTCP